METGNICRLIFLLVVTGKHIAFATDGNDICQKEVLFERLIELEYKVKEMSKQLDYKMKEMDKEMVKANAGLIGLLDAQNRRIEEMVKANAGLIGLLDAQNRRIEELVSPTQGDKLDVAAFSSYNPVSKSPTTGNVIIFGSTQLNEGSAYSTINGVFTVPDDGLYEFNANICNADGKYIVYAINRNGNETLALSTQWDDTGSCGSVNALARLNAGEKVFLECDYCESGVQFYENRHHRNTFSGVRLH